MLSSDLASGQIEFALQDGKGVYRQKGADTWLPFNNFKLVDAVSYNASPTIPEYSYTFRNDGIAIAICTSGYSDDLSLTENSFVGLSASPVLLKKQSAGGDKNGTYRYICAAREGEKFHVPSWNAGGTQHSAIATYLMFEY